VGIKERWKGYKGLPEDILTRVENLKDIFKKHGVTLAYLFGSLARNKTNDDIDIAVLSRQKNLLSLIEDISIILGTDRIDIIDLSQASPVMRMNIIKSGKLIYKENGSIENEFESRVLKEYRDTAFLRMKQRKILEEKLINGSEKRD